MMVGEHFFLFLTVFELYFHLLFSLQYWDQKELQLWYEFHCVALVST